MPARRLVRRAAVLAAPALSRTGLDLPAWRMYERVRARTGRRERASVADGLPLPPASLRVRVINDADPHVFLSNGKQMAQTISEAFAAHGLPVERCGRLLDFGCGCARVTRHWHGIPDLEVHASDHDRLLVDWIADELPFIRSNRNELAPPLPYADSSFGLIYTISVLTHLTEPLGEAWMRELRRILRPGGLLLFTVHGEHLADRLGRRDRAAFDRGEFVVQFGDAAGSNLCTSFHPQAYVHRLTRGLEILERRPPKERDVFPQEVWIARRPET